MTFGAPLWMVALPLLAVAAITLARRDAAARAALPGERGLVTEARGGRTRGAWRRACEWLGAALVVAALALPRCDREGGAAPRPALLVVDVSRSMLAEDVDGPRFAMAKRATGAALAALAGRRVGLVTFAGASVEVAPPTADLAALRALLDEIDPRRTVDPGSDPVSALERALARLPAGGDVVVLSDGEWEGDASGERAVAEAAVRAKVAFHVVALGGTAPVALIAREPDGSMRPLVDGAGRPAVTRADPARLVALAEAAGGRVVEAGGDGRAFAFLASGEATRDAPPAAALATPWSFALGFALALLTAAHALRERTS